MAVIDDKIEQLHQRLENLVKYQGYFDNEISQIRYEISVLRAVQQKRNAPAETPNKPRVREYVPPSKSAEPPPAQAEKQTPPSYQPAFQKTGRDPNYRTSDSSRAKPIEAEAVKANLEKYVGENLLSKLGILILVVGVAIGAKYAIDNNLISPLARIIAGYGFGFGLLGLAVRLKAKYLNFSAVLLSGAMAIMYFITYFAYGLYGLFPQSSAFALMLIFTVFTVASALNYDRQIIAHLGLVGAYGVPFLLSNNSGNFAFLFTYIAIINGGILAVSLRKYWKPLFYTSFIFTWATYYGWYLTKFRSAEHLFPALLFSSVFFLIFYLTFLGYKLVSRENVALENVALVLANSFIFYGLGYSIFDHSEGFGSFLGLFTVINAAIHFAFAATVSRMKNIPQDLIYLLSALVLTFATIAVPVQLDGNFVTLAWTAEAAILFWIGRTKQIRLYEYYSFPLMFLASVSLLADWLNNSDFSATREIAQNSYALFNGTFITSIVYVLAFVLIHFLNKDEKYEPALSPEIHRPLSNIIPALALLALYNTFRMEIGNYFAVQSVKTAISDPSSLYYHNGLRTDPDLVLFNVLWQINYTLFFLSALSLVNVRKWKSPALAVAALMTKILTMVIFLTAGLYLLAELRTSYLLQTDAQTFARGSMHILVRYISLAFFAAAVFALYQNLKQRFVREYLPEVPFTPFFDFILYVSLWIVSSSELINWMDIGGYNDSYKLGLSILWGVYALLLIVLGIYQNKKHLRLGAIVLFGITLAKLFFYDIAELDTISKTIVFVSLGILLLIVSFLYTKYKHLIFETNESDFVDEN